MKEKFKDKKVYAFIDSQNLNLSVKNNLTNKVTGEVYYFGWELDYAKFRVYLKEKYNVEKAYLFIGLVPGMEMLYKELQEAGFILIQKPTLTRREAGHLITKGNVDAELVLHASAIEYSNYDLAVVISGDGDFRCLYEFLKDRKKLGKVIIPNKQQFSSLLRKFSDYFDFVSNKRKLLETESEHD